MVETVLGFVLGALIGAIATAAGSYLVYWRRQRARTRRLRAALRHELESMEQLAELVADGRYEAVTKRVPPRPVYEANAGEIGHLSEEEVETIVACYAGLARLDGMEDPEDRSEEIDAIVERRRAAIRLLSDGDRSVE